MAQSQKLRTLGAVRLDSRGRVYLKRLSEPAIAQGEMWALSVDDQDHPTRIVLDLMPARLIEGSDD